MKRALPRGMIPLLLFCGGVIGMGAYCQAVTAGTEPGRGAEMPKLVRVGTLDSAAARQEFQREIEALQRQEAQVAARRSELRQARAGAARDCAAQELEQAVRMLRDGNARRFRTYGFLLNRRFVLVPDKGAVFIYVAAEDALRPNGEPYVPPGPSAG